jgi:hypothetical protein
MPALSDIKNAIQQLIPQGVDQTLKRLEEVLQPGTPRYNDYLQIKARYSAYLSSLIRGDVSVKDQTTAYNGITYALLLFSETLTEGDFRTGSEPQPQPAPAKQGELLYFIPHQMGPNREYRCSVRLAYLKDILFQNWEVQVGDVQQSIRVAEVMSVELINFDESNPFAIRTLSDTVQFLDQGDFTEWLFFVKPLQAGTFPLILRVAVLEVRNGREVKKDVIIEEQILVSTEAPEPVVQFTSGDLNVSIGPAAESVSRGMEPPSPSPEQPMKGPPSGSESPGGIYTDILTDTKSVYNKSEEAPKGKYTLPEPMETESPVPTRGQNRGLRIVAVLMAIMIFGGTASWALTPPETKDWVWARYVKDNEQTYTDFIQKYPKSTRRETAVYRKAFVAPSVQNLKRYNDDYPAGHFKNEIQTRLQGIEFNQISEIHRNPDARKIRQFLADFPDSERLPEVKQEITKKVEFRQELMPELEKTYMETIRRKPNAPRIREFLRSFPESQKVSEIREIIRRRPDLQQAVGSDLQEPAPAPEPEIKRRRIKKE